MDEVLPGIYRIEHAATNCYLVEHDGALVFVDAGLPRTWSRADRTLRALRRSWADVAAIVLTHAHFDHLGFAARAQRDWGIPVWAHPADHRIAEHPYRYRPGRPRLLYPLRYPAAWSCLGPMIAAGALRVPGVQRLERLTADRADVPAGLRVIETPGHTNGHCVLHLPERDVVFTGDALVTLDPYTARRGPRIVARAGTFDAAGARASLEPIAATGARVVLPGHGEPWLDGAASAVAAAQTAEVA